MIKVAGLWKHKVPNKDDILSGNLGGVRIVIFKNTFKKESSNEPDYQMYFDEQKKKGIKETTSKVDKPPVDDDIPF